MTPRGSAESLATDDDARRAVLRAVRVLGLGSRAEIARATGLGRAAVAQRLAELAASGVVVEAGSGPSTGGRPPRKIRFRSEAGYILVADLGATSLDVAVAKPTGDAALNNPQRDVRVSLLLSYQLEALGR